MYRASEHGFAAGRRASGDVVVAFRPQLLAAYCLNVQELHESQELSGEWTKSTEGSGPLSPDTGEHVRSTIERRLKLAFRAWDFSHRIRTAYRNRCAICGLGLELIEGAHIVPVAWPGSSDETDNGLALCRNHHAAYDRGIISVSPHYEIQVSTSARELNRLSALDRSWLDDLGGRLLTILPTVNRERPSPQDLAIGREARRWGSR